MHNRYREEEKLEKELAKEQGTEEEEIKEEEIDLANSKEVDFNLEKLQIELNSYKEKYLRTLAEAENYKKRINDERIRERKYFNQSLFERIVETVDVFDRTVNFNTDDEKLKNFLIGFQMINKELKQILADEGVKEIESVGLKFNPAVHHAIEVAYDENYAEDIILAEVQRGYTYKDRILRAALVKVNKKEEINNG